MRYFTPSIFYHGENLPERVYSIDFEPHGNRFATCGADPDVHVWEFRNRTPVDGTPEQKDDAPLKIIAKLSAHQKEVNTVRFSPSGQFIASGGSDELLIIWEKSETLKTSIGIGQTEEDIFDEQWMRFKTFRCMSSVLNLSWSPCNEYIAASVEDDNVIVFSMKQGRAVQKLDGHTHLVQGVAWSPFANVLASQSTDRTLKFWNPLKNKFSIPGSQILNPTTSDELMSEEPNNNTATAVANNSSVATSKLFQLKQSVNKFELPIPSNAKGVLDLPTATENDDHHSENNNNSIQNTANSSNGAQDNKSNNVNTPEHQNDDKENQTHQERPQAWRKGLFLSDSACPSFVRRPDWTPDGSFLLAPAAQLYLSEPSKHSSMSPDNNAEHKQVWTCCTMAFHRMLPNTPIAAIPSVDGPSVVIRSCPVVFDGGDATQPPSKPYWGSVSTARVVMARHPKGLIAPVASEPVDEALQSPDVCGMTSEDGGELIKEANAASTTTPVAKTMEYTIEYEDSAVPTFTFDGQAREGERRPRFVFAVLHVGGSVVIYDNLSSTPLAFLTRIHHQGLTDAAWSSDGRVLAVSSSDGSITFIFFKEGELGTPLGHVRMPVVLPSTKIRLANKIKKKENANNTGKVGSDPNYKSETDNNGMDVEEGNGNLCNFNSNDDDDDDVEMDNIESTEKREIRKEPTATEDSEDIVKAPSKKRRIIAEVV